MQKSFCILLLTSTLAFGQKSDLKVSITSTLAYIRKAENYSDQAHALMKKAVATQDKDQIKTLCDEANQLAMKAKEQSDFAEKQADLVEASAKKIGCFNAAAEADDAEDYCRQLGYHSYEISIYVQKCAKELELIYKQEYLNKALHYSEEAYEAIKNSRVELENALKDLEACN